VTAPAPAHETAPVVVRDVFPAEVSVGGSVYRTARVVITRERVYVWQAEGRDRHLRVEFAYDPERSAIPRYNASPREEAKVYARTVDDLAGALIVRRQRGCGCGSSLRGWRPWQPYRVASS
jgi:hypothetical protein